MRTMTIAACVAVLCAAPAALAAQAPAYKRDVPDSLLKTAKIAESRAAEIAQHQVPNGKIENLELEREHGTLIYSFEIKVAGKAGITEVNVDAMTGHVGPLEHEKD